MDKRIKDKKFKYVRNIYHVYKMQGDDVLCKNHLGINYSFSFNQVLSKIKAYENEVVS